MGNELVVTSNGRMSVVGNSISEDVAVEVVRAAYQNGYVAKKVTVKPVDFDVNISTPVGSFGTSYHSRTTILEFEKSKTD